MGALALVLLLVVLGLGPGTALADAAPQRWNLTDQGGQRWSLSLFAQPDPAYPGGDRLRLNALSPGLAVDHRRPLRISDGLGQAWQLANRSEELVAPGAEALPPGSAQFDAADLRPRPSEALPLLLAVPLAGGEEALLPLGPQETLALHALSEASLSAVAAAPAG
jgi:hypothetical protein